jgi:glycosyltransferase involved in cell wall biosynthesis
MSPPAGRLRILVVAAGEPWPLDTGARLHVFHVVRQLAQHGVVTLLLPGPPLHAERLPARLRVEWPRGALCAPSVGVDAPLVWRWARRHFGWQPALAAWLTNHAHPDRFDVALLHGPRGALYAPACGVPPVWDLQDELVLPLLRELEFAAWRDRPRLLRRVALYIAYERAAMQRAAATIFVANSDASYARRWSPRARVAVIANGVDTEYFRPDETAARPGTLAFVGALNFEPNVDGITWFVRTAWPYIWAANSSRRLLIVGRAPTAAVRELRNVPGVTVVADVPDVRPYLRQAQVVIVPVRKGGGLKNKVLEACAMARPVVATSRALAGLSARRGHDVLVADGAAMWVAQIERLLRSPGYADAIAQNGYAWVRRAHSWEDAGSRFFALLTDTAQRRPSSDRYPRFQTDAPSEANVASPPERSAERRTLRVANACDTLQEAVCR